MRYYPYRRRLAVGEKADGSYKAGPRWGYQRSSLNLAFSLKMSKRKNEG